MVRSEHVDAILARVLLPSAPPMPPSPRLKRRTRATLRVSPPFSSLLLSCRAAIASGNTPAPPRFCLRQYARPARLSLRDTPRLYAGAQSPRPQRPGSLPHNALIRSPRINDPNSAMTAAYARNRNARIADEQSPYGGAGGIGRTKPVWRRRRHRATQSPYGAAGGIGRHKARMAP